MTVRDSTKVNRKVASDFLPSTRELTPSAIAKLAVAGGAAFRKAGHHALYLVKGLDSGSSGLIGPRVRSSSELLQNAA